jgi:hypothetical protein
VAGGRGGFVLAGKRQAGEVCERDRAIGKRWRQAPALANVPHKESLAKLPAAERAAWRKLWAEGDDALKRPAANP